MNTKLRGAISRTVAMSKINDVIEEITNMNKSSEHKMFWMVYCEGRNTPNIKHDVRQDAMVEAKRIAISERRTTYVLGFEFGFEYPEPEPVIFTPNGPKVISKELIK